MKNTTKWIGELKPDEYDNYQGILRLQEVCKNFEKMWGVEVNTIISKGNWNLSTKQISYTITIYLAVKNYWNKEYYTFYFSNSFNVSLIYR